MLKNTSNTNGSNHKFDVVLVPYVEIMDITRYYVQTKNFGLTIVSEEWYADGNEVTVRTSAFPRNIGYISRYFAVENSNTYYTMGYEDTYSFANGKRHGTVRLVFAGSGENATVNAEFEDSIHGTAIPTVTVTDSAGNTHTIGEITWDMVKSKGFYDLSGYIW